MSDWVEELEASARGRFVRWDPGVWREVREGPAQVLGHTLRGETRTEAEALLRDYLRLAAEAIGLGYLYPASAGRPNFFTLAWTDLVPRLLPSVPHSERARVLAQLWNLGENLESAPPWVQRLFCRVVSRLDSLVELESTLRSTAAAAMEPPTTPLGADAKMHQVDLSREDARFLPGAIHFLAPTVVCVHDRHRPAVAGREAATQGVWLSEAPVLLGPMGCTETPDVALPELPLLPKDEWYACAVNEWRAAATLHTSQWLVVLV